jgi:hypothetical protein
VVFRPVTTALALGVTALFLLIAQLVVLRWIRRTNWLEAIKSKE